MIHMEKIRDSKGVIIEDRETMCKAVIRLAEAKQQKIEIATSALSLVEVCKHPKSKSTKTSDLVAFFEHDYVLLVNLDWVSGDKARELMQAGYSGLKPPDAVHIAAAIVSNADELHTFDGRLLGLDGLISKADGTKLKIVKPDSSSVPPLLQKATEQPAVTISTTKIAEEEDEKRSEVAGAVLDAVAAAAEEPRPAESLETQAASPKVNAENSPESQLAKYEEVGKGDLKA